MKTKRSKTKLIQESTIRDIVRDEIRLHSRQITTLSSRSVNDTKRYVATKNRLMLDLIKPMISQDNLGNGLASQIVKSILRRV